MCLDVQADKTRLGKMLPPPSCRSPYTTKVLRNVTQQGKGGGMAHQSDGSRARCRK